MVDVLPTDVLARADAFIQQTLRELPLPGLAVAIVADGRVVYCKGLGIAGAGRAMQGDTPQIIGSVSKSFTALGVMQLVERGLLELDQPVITYLPWFTLASADAARRITLRHLMLHTSGLSRYEGRNLLAGWKSRSMEAAVHAMASLRVSREPGERFEYSNLNYLVLGLLIEVVSGQTYADYIRQAILEPLGMEHTFLTEEQALAADPALATGYRWWFGWPVPFRAPYLVDGLPAAYIISSASDLARWMVFHLSDGGSLLSPAGMRALHEAQVPTHRAGQMSAMGWRVSSLGSVPLLHHGGEVTNFGADMVLAPGAGLGVAVIYNANNGLAAQRGYGQIGRNLVRLLLGQPVPRPAVSFPRFYAVVTVLAALLVALEIALWMPLRSPTGVPILLRVLLLAFDVIVPVAALWRLPKAVDISWKGLMLYVPDVALLVLAMCGVSFLRAVVSVVQLLHG